MVRETSPRPKLRPEGFGISNDPRATSPRPKLRPLEPTAVMSPATYGSLSNQTEENFGPARVSSMDEVERINNTPIGFEQRGSLSKDIGGVVDPFSDEKVNKIKDYLKNAGPVQKQRDPFDEVLARGWIKAINDSPYGNKYRSNLNLLTQDGVDTVKGMFKNSLGAMPVTKDGTPWDPRVENWCATFVNTVLMGLGADLLQTGDKYDRLRARKYVNYGSPVSRDNLKQGDIVVLDFPRNADGDIDFRDPNAKRDGKGDHVTFYAGENSGANRPGTGFIGVLGGNQGSYSEIGLTEYSDDNILATRRITYDDIDYEFTKELAKENPDFNNFLKKESEGFDMESFSNPDRLGFFKGGVVKSQTDKLLGKSKGMGYGELILDNIIGLDNEYESFGERLGKAINEDEIGFLRDAAVGVVEGAKEFVSDPVGVISNVATDIKDSVQRLGTEDLDTRLRRMYGIGYTEATEDQVSAAREAVLGDALTALELVPAAKGVQVVGKAAVDAVPSGIKADVVGQTKAMLSGDKEFLTATPTDRTTTQSLSAAVPESTDKPRVPDTKPKSQVNPLFKDFKDQWNPRPNAINPRQALENRRRWEGGTGTISFYNPIESALENLPMKESGMTGKQIKAYLTKRAPNVSKKNLEYSNLTKSELDKDSNLTQVIKDDKVYTKDEILSLVRQRQPRVVARVLRGEDLTAYPGQQLQSNIGLFDENDLGGLYKPSDYYEVAINQMNNENRKFSKEFHYGENNIGHSRATVHTTRADYEPFILIEEFQSDAVQNIGLRKRLQIPENEFIDQGYEALEEFAHNVEMQEDFLNPFVTKESLRELATIASKTKGEEANVPEVAKKIEEYFKKAQSDSYTYTTPEDIFNVRVSVDEMDEVADLAEFTSYNLARLMYTDNSYNYSAITDEIHDVVVGDLFDAHYKGGWEGRYAADNLEVKPEDVPVRLTDTVKQSLMVHFIEAKKRGINTIVLPSLSKIVEARRAQGASEKGLANTYDKAFNKALRELNSELNNKITVTKQPLPYSTGDSTATFLNISDLDINPDTVVPRFNKGGDTMQQQMNGLMMARGGLRDDGMTTDPVSGNDIPPGSLAEEVRDDIPAQLSGGEYVVPADVVRYYGVQYFEDLREQAKAGLADMEANGRIGGEPVEAAYGGLMGKRGYNNGGLEDEIRQINQQATFNPYGYLPVGATYFGPTAVGPGNMAQPVVDPATMCGEGTVYDPELKVCVPEPVETPVTAPSTNDSPPPPPPQSTDTDPRNYRGVSFDDPLGAAREAAEGLTPAGVTGGALGYIVGGMSNLNKLSVARANLKLAVDQGYSEAEIAKVQALLDEQESKLGWGKTEIDDNLIASGQQRYLAATKHFTGLEKQPKTVTGTGAVVGGGGTPPDPTPEPVKTSTSKTSAEQIAQRQKDRSNDTRSTNFGQTATQNLAGKTTAQKEQIMKSATTGITKGPSASAGATTASTAGGGTTAGGAELDTRFGITGLNKGGLMKPKKK